MHYFIVSGGLEPQVIYFDVIPLCLSDDNVQILIQRHLHLLAAIQNHYETTFERSALANR